MCIDYLRLNEDEIKKVRKKSEKKLQKIMSDIYDINSKMDSRTI